jgi:hypothetical protein
MLLWTFPETIYRPAAVLLLLKHPVGSECQWKKKKYVSESRFSTRSEIIVM